MLSNHDVIRHASRFGGEYGRATASDGIGPSNPQPDSELGLRKARAATLFMLGLPGASYLYQGEELGLPEHTTLEPKHRQDPTFARTKGERVGRDGCRVPLPWVAGGEANGFSSVSGWLPQPVSYAELARESQVGNEGSTLELYKSALRLRKRLSLGEGSFDWVLTGDVLSYKNGNITVSHNFGSEPKELTGKVLLRSSNQEGPLQPNESAWTD